MKRQKFSLIELLIVVVVIAILAALILPSLISARYRAHTMQCVSHNKQLAQTSAMYAGANDGYLPFANWISRESKSPSDGMWSGPGWLYSKRYGNSEPSDLKHGALWEYIGDDRIYRCPTDRWRFETPLRLGTNAMTSFISNGASVGYGKGPRDAYGDPIEDDQGVKLPPKLPSVRMTNIDVDQAILYWCQVNKELDAETIERLLKKKAPPSFWQDGSSRPMDDIWDKHNPEHLLPRRHMNRLSVSCVDGSAEAMTSYEIDDLLYSEGKSRLNWSPYTETGRPDK